MIEIEGKTYDYFMKRKHVGMFTRIIGELIEEEKLEQLKSNNEIVLLVKIIKEALLSFDKANDTSLKFIAAIYNIKESEVEELGFFGEFKLWKNLFNDPEFKDFFSLVFRSKLTKN
jgi:hypothetical protein